MQNYANIIFPFVLDSGVWCQQYDQFTAVNTYTHTHTDTQIDL